MGVEITAGSDGSSAEDRTETKRPVFPAMMRGTKCKCPNCGTGRMFSSWLKVSPHCQECGEALYHERAQDFPPYITIFIVGHVVVTLIMLVEAAVSWSLGLHLVVWLSVTVVMCLAMIQPVKGAVVGLQWALRMGGFDGRPESDEGASW